MAGNFLSQSSILKKGLIKNNKINGNIPMKIRVDLIEGHEVSRKQCKGDCVIFMVWQKLSIDQLFHKFLFFTSSQLEWIDLLCILSSCRIYKHFDPILFKFVILLIAMIY